MQTVGSNTKLCVTCAMYDGPRVPKEHFVDFEQFSCGKCYARFPQGIDVKPCYSCSAWTKWAALR